MRVGLDHYTIAHRGLTPFETLDFVQARGLEGVQFLEPTALDPNRDPAALGRLRDRAAELGLYLEVGIPSPNPVRRSRLAGTQVSAEQHARDLEPDIESAVTLGVRHVRAYVGDRHDRFRSDTPWKQQLAETASVIRHLAPCLRLHGVRIAIETHADVTVVELLRLIDELGTDLVGVTLDTGNLLMRLEDPVAAARALAPFVLATHIKDAILARTPRGLCWQARPVGSGIVPIREIVAILAEANPSLNLSIELHPRIYDLPILDPTWLAYFPDLRPDQLGTVERFADAFEARHIYKEGNRPLPAEIEAIPWPERDLSWINQSTQFLKQVVRDLSV